MLKNRGINILKRLAEEGSVISLSDLSEELKISTRSVRYELDAIDYLLEKNSLPPLLRRKGGVCFEGTQKERFTVLALLDGNGAYDRVLSQNERLFGILYRLLINGEDEFVTSYDIAEKMFVSRSTVINDLAKIKQHFPYRSAVIQNVAHYGFRLNGLEEDIRDSVTSFLQKHVKIDEILRIIKSVRDKKGKCEDNSLNYIFRNINYSDIDLCIKKIEYRTNKSCADSIYIYLFLSLSVTVLRIRNHDTGNSEGSCDSDTEVLFDNVVLKEIIHDMEELFHIMPSGFDEKYIAKIINYALFDEGTPDLSTNYIDKQVIMLDFIDSVGRNMGENFIKDKILIDSLNANICAILDQKRYPSDFNEDIHLYLHELFPDVLEAVRLSIHILKEGLEISMDGSWENYIAAAFVEALQRCRPLNNVKKDVLLVCASGQITSRLLSYRLNAMFEINIVDILPYNQLEKYLNSHRPNAVIISTIPLDVPEYIRVSPMLKEEDIKILKKKLPTRVLDYHFLSKIIDIVSDNCQIVNYKKLYDHMIDIFGFRDYGKVFEKPKLEDIVKSDNILLDYECESWREAVAASGEILLKNGYIKRGYINDIIGNLEEKRQYVVIAQGIALPHAKSFNYVNKIGMSVLRLKTPVEFGDSPNGPVDLVFCFCTTDNKAHLEALRQFNIMISEEGTLRKIRAAKSKDEVMRIINEISHK